MKKTYSSAEILEGFRKNDEEIIVFTYKNCFGAILDFVRKNRGSDVDAEDVMQEAMIFFYRKSKKTSFDNEHQLLAFIVYTGKFLWQNKLKSNNYNQTKIPIDSIEFDKINDFSEETDNKEEIRLNEKRYEERKKVYKSCYLKLNIDCRKIIALTIEGKNNKEIKKAMQFADENITVDRKRRCKQKLLELISNHPKYKELNNEY